MKKKKNDTLFCIDFETGGLDPKKHAITQVALQIKRMDDFETIATYSDYVIPYGDYLLTDESLKYTGITYQKLNSKGVKIEDVVKKIETILAEVYKEHNTSRKKNFILGQNVIFDIGFLKQIFNFVKPKTANKTFEKYFHGEVQQSSFHFATIDTMILGKMKHLGYRDTRFNLTQLCENEGIEIIDAHDGENDVEATLKLYNKYRHDLNSESLEKEDEQDYIKNFEF